MTWTAMAGWGRGVSSASVLQGGLVGGFEGVEEEALADDENEDEDEDEDEEEGFGYEEEEEEEGPEKAALDILGAFTSSRAGEGTAGREAAGEGAEDEEGKKRRKLNKPKLMKKYMKLPTDGEGRVLLPIVFKGFTVHAIGHIVTTKPQYHARRYVWPVGFVSTRTYFSMDDCNRRCEYTSLILDGGESPQFVVVPHDHNPPIVKDTPSGAWAEVGKRVSELRAQKRGSKINTQLSGPEMFGFSHPSIAKIIQEMPGADQCVKYSRQHYVPSGEALQRGAHEVLPHCPLDRYRSLMKPPPGNASSSSFFALASATPLPPSTSTTASSSISSRKPLPTLSDDPITSSSSSSSSSTTAPTSSSTSTTLPSALPLPSIEHAPPVSAPSPSSSSTPSSTPVAAAAIKAEPSRSKTHSQESRLHDDPEPDAAVSPPLPPAFPSGIEISDPDETFFQYEIQADEGFEM